MINIFWDHEGPTIAFNRGGTIFCNACVILLYEKQLLRYHITGDISGHGVSMTGNGEWAMLTPLCDRQ